MQGRHLRALRGGRLLGLLTAVAGCGDAVPAPPASVPPPALATHFDVATTETLSGRLTWEGAVPVVPPYQSPARPLAEPPRGPRRAWDNPNAPLVDPVTRGVKDVAVFLRRVDLARSRPWHHAPARVELGAYRIHIRQGEQTSRFGFVRQGETVEMLSLDEAAYSLRVRGAAFFSLPFPEPNRPCVRPMPRKGVVELSSGAGQFWMRGYLLVTDHPYCARTDRTGQFSLAQVPEGQYELVCWVPNWHTARRERDGDTALTTRLSFQPPVELVRRVRVQRGRGRAVAFEVSAKMFESTR